jgi:hypothetical protein
MHHERPFLDEVAELHDVGNAIVAPRYSEEVAALYGRSAVRCEITQCALEFRRGLGR